ncbi:MAG: hypothetical protein WC804_21550 [Sphingomonas sp.]|jgi:hypothetical protein|uniref:hypothetical protein n=1 Tax=Sphingomonas sp. TaxID=28214 RepID=UPI0035659D39
MTVPSALALVGRKNLVGVDQCAAVVWRRGAVDPRVEQAIVATIEKTPDALTSIFSSTSDFEEDDSHTTRFGLTHMGGTTALYVGKLAFLKLKGSKRGRIPFGAFYFLAADREAWRLAPNCLKEIERLFNWYRHASAAEGSIVCAVDGVGADQINVWSPTFPDMFERDADADHSRPGHHRDGGNTFFLDNDADPENVATLNRCIDAFRKSGEEFDAFVAQRRPLQESMRRQAATRLISYRRIDEIEAGAAHSVTTPVIGRDERETAAPVIDGRHPVPIDQEPRADNEPPQASAYPMDPTSVQLRQTADALRSIDRRLDWMQAYAKQHAETDRHKLWISRICAALLFLFLLAVCAVVVLAVPVLLKLQAVDKVTTGPPSGTGSGDRIHACLEEPISSLEPFKATKSPLLKDIVTHKDDKLAARAVTEEQAVGFVNEVARISRASLQDCVRKAASAAG